MEKFTLFLVLVLFVCISFPVLSEEEGPSVAELRNIREQRKTVLQEKRRIIFNNDGDDVANYLKDRTLKSILVPRSNELRNSQVDSVFYSTHASFGTVSHRSKVGFIRKRGAHRELSKLGTDTLQITLDFCKENGLEFFWSMRMNDTHDGLNYDWASGAFSQFKKDHLEWIVGTPENKPPHGYWTAADFTHPEVREMSFRLMEEVCQNYDIDGIELDFFRWLLYFKSVAYGGEASDAERDMMTELVRRIRTMTEVEGIKRGRPYMVAVRVPDSVEYCRAIGLDIERWMKEGLIDILIPGGDFVLNTMKYSVDLGHKYGVKVYPDFDPCTSAAKSGQFDRNSTNAWRSRAMEAWQAGADGVYTFNWFNTWHQSYDEMGDPKILAKLDKDYFINVTGKLGWHRAEQYLADGYRFHDAPSLHPDHPEFLSMEKSLKLPMMVGDNVLWGIKEGVVPEIVCNLWLPKVTTTDQVVVKLNGRQLKGGKFSDEWITYPVNPRLVKKGENLFEVSMAPQNKKGSGDERWDMVYICDKLLVYPTQLPWRRLFGSIDQVEEMRDGHLFMADNSDGVKNLMNLVYPWNIRPEEETVMEARVKVVESTNPMAVCVRMANGVSVDYLTLEKGKVGLHFAGLSVAMNTTDKFHTYRVVLKGNDIKLYIDGELKLDGKGSFTTSVLDEKTRLKFPDTPDDWGNRKSVLFGSASVAGSGGAFWEYIKFRSQSYQLRDLVLSIRYNKK
jgi:Glycosyl hydrolase-like 10